MITEGPNREGSPEQQLFLIWLVETSAAMLKGRRIEAINQAMHDSIQTLKRSERIGSQLMFGVISFSDGAIWHLQPRLLSEVSYTDIRPDAGVVDLGSAFRVLAAYFGQNEEARGPALIGMILDGAPTDDAPAALRFLAHTRSERVTNFVVISTSDYAEDGMRGLVSDPVSVRARSADELADCVKSVFSRLDAPLNFGFGSAGQIATQGR